MILFIFTIFFQMLSFGTSIEDTIRSKTISYLEVFEKAGIYAFGKTETVSLFDIKNDVLNAQFILVSDDVFSKNIDKSRRSAFYDKDTIHPRIFINADYLPQAELIIHEILQDQHYEFSIAMSALHDELTKNGADLDLESINIYRNSTDQIFDSFGIKSKYLEGWVGSKSLDEFQKNNSTLYDDGGEGGDVSGGGGDPHSFSLKKETLQLVIEKLKVEIKKEYPSMSNVEIENHLSKSYIRLLRKVYVDTDYNNSSSKIEFSIAKDFQTTGFESDFAMVPYFIKVPVKMDKHAVANEISNVIYQTMFGQMSFINNEYFSPCKCVRNDGVLVHAVYRCPNQKVHPSLKVTIQILKKDIEDQNRCKIELTQ